MFGQPFRITPNAPAWAYRTYGLSMPLATHFRAASCSEVDCEHHANGWVSYIDENINLGKEQAAYIRARCGRAFTESRTPEGLTAFTFAAGQKCFREHRVHLDREPNYVVRGGDWRGDPRGEGTRVHKRAEDWIDQFAHDLDVVKTARERG